MTRISVLIPAHNEGSYVGACLSALLASDTAGLSPEVIVAANGCSDDTVHVARSHEAQARAQGWTLTVIDIAEAGKLNALNIAEKQAGGDILVYLDADVLVAPALVAQLAEILQTDAPRYASGTPVVTADGAFSRAYARFWARLPFVRDGVPGFGVFAVNRIGRARWETFPDIISDDTFVRLSFAPGERHRVPATYRWPSIEGLHNLIRVRRRQDEGVREVAALYPELMQNADTDRVSPLRLAGLAARDPLGFAAYILVRLVAKTPLARGARWARGR